MTANPRISLSLISSVAGFLALAIMSVSLTISVIFCQQFSPFDFWMEDYGSVSRNPCGAAFYDIGIMVTGVLLCVFILGFRRWYTSSTRYNALIIIGQISGIMAATALMLEGYAMFFQHLDPVVWSATFFILALISIIAVTTGTMVRSEQHENTIYVGIMTIALILLLAITLYFNIAPVIIEWFAVLSMMIWVGLASRDMYRLSAD
jgi:hypothetical membrane protein